MAARCRIVAQLHEARIEAGFSQRHLAALAGVPVSQINAWDSGGHSPTLPNLERWAAALGYDVILRARSLDGEQEASNGS